MILNIGFVARKIKAIFSYTLNFTFIKIVADVKPEYRKFFNDMLNSSSSI